MQNVEHVAICRTLDTPPNGLARWSSARCATASGSTPRRLKPGGRCLFLHGFPETLYAWKDIAPALADDYEVHAFDWPGFGLSARPPVEKFSYAPKDYARVLKEYIRKSNLDASTLTIYAIDIGALPALLLALEEPGIAQAIIVGDFAPLNRPQYMVDNLQALKTRDQEYFEANLGRLRTPVKIVWGEKDFYIKKEMGLELAQKAKLQIEVLANIGHYPHLQEPRRTSKTFAPSREAADGRRLPAHLRSSPRVVDSER